MSSRKTDSLRQMVVGSTWRLVLQQVRPRRAAAGLVGARPPEAGASGKGEGAACRGPALSSHEVNVCSALRQAQQGSGKRGRRRCSPLGPPGPYPPLPPPPPQRSSRVRVRAAEASPVQQRHLDDKGKEVVDDGVEELVCQLPPRQVGHALELVVEVELQGCVGAGGAGGKVCGGGKRGGGECDGGLGRGRGASWRKAQPAPPVRICGRHTHTHTHAQRALPGPAAPPPPAVLPGPSLPGPACGHMRMKPKAYTAPTRLDRIQLYQLLCVLYIRLYSSARDTHAQARAAAAFSR